MITKRMDFLIMNRLVTHEDFKSHFYENIVHELICIFFVKIGTECFFPAIGTLSQTCQWSR